MNTRVRNYVPLPAPRVVLNQHPLSKAAQACVASYRQRVARIVRGVSSEKLVIVGPCSVHDPAAVLDYAKHLKSLDLNACVLMRVYFEKPRTAHGWPGFTMDPELNGSYDMLDGLLQTRQLLVKLCEMGIGVATEMLSLVLPQYTSDCISFVAIGARTTESQPHRELASGLSMPVGFKNDSAGDVGVAINAMISCSAPKGFIGCDESGKIVGVRTEGNFDTVLILRGSYTSGPNFDDASVHAVVNKLQAKEKPLRVLIDASHGNSNKCIRRQADVIRYLAASPSPHVAGIMVESFLQAGSQKLPKHRGMSITDPCLGWHETMELLRLWTSRTSSEPSSPTSSSGTTSSSSTPPPEPEKHSS